jgi:hypothetical protein
VLQIHAVSRPRQFISHLVAINNLKSSHCKCKREVKNVVLWDVTPCSQLGAPGIARYYSLLAVFLLDLLFDTDDEGGVFLRN